MTQHDRFIVAPGSQAGHDCCFTHTVLDTEDQSWDEFNVTKFIDACPEICECPSLQMAEWVAAALNAMEGTSTRIWLANTENSEESND